MNIRFSPRALALFLGGILLASASGTLSAQTLTWGAGGAGGSGQWDDTTTTVDWYNGSANVHWTDGDSAVFAGTAGTVSISGSVTASQVTFNTAGYTLQNFFLNGTGSGLTVQTNADTTISSSIFGAAPYNTGFTKSGTGLLLLNGGSTPVFFGTITVADGELRYGSAFLNSSTPFVLGNTAAAALTFANSTATVGSLAGGGTTGGVVRPAAASGNFILAINGGSDATYGGTLAGNGNAVLALQKFGTSTQTLINSSPALTGTTTVGGGGKLVLTGPNGALPNTSGVVLDGGGTLQLDNSTDVNQTRLASSVPVTLNGGTLSFLGNSAAQDAHQTVGALNVASGASTVSATTAGTGVAQLYFSSNLARTSGATVSFSDGGHVLLTGAANTNGILGGYATVGADWAATNASGGVIAYTGYASDTTTAGSTDNLRVAAAGGTTSLASVTSRNSLNLVNTGSGVATLDLGSNAALDLTSGGLLTSGSGGWIIQGRKFSSSGGEVIITNQSALTVASVIAEAVTGTALTKAGGGTLVLAGANTYTGTTTIDQGTVQVSADANLGAGKVVALNGGTLQATAGFTSSKSLQGSGGTVDTGSNTVGFSGGVNTGSLTKIGAGILSLAGQVGSITINGGTLQLTQPTSSTSSSVTILNGRLEASGSGLQTVTDFGGSANILSPGAHGQAQTLTIGFLSLLQPSTVDFDVGSAGSDLLSVTTNLSLGGTSPALLFRFNNLGGVQTGTAYPVLQLPSSQAFAIGAGSFGIDSVSAAAGYKGAFSVVNGTVDVTFSAVPEPSPIAASLCGVLVVWGGRTLARRRAERENSAN